MIKKAAVAVCLCIGFNALSAMDRGGLPSPYAKLRVTPVAAQIRNFFPRSGALASKEFAVLAALSNYEKSPTDKNRTALTSALTAFFCEEGDLNVRRREGVATLFGIKIGGSRTEMQDLIDKALQGDGYVPFIADEISPLAVDGAVGTPASGWDSPDETGTGGRRGDRRRK